MVLYIFKRLFTGKKIFIEVSIPFPFYLPLRWKSISFDPLPTACLRSIKKERNKDDMSSRSDIIKNENMAFRMNKKRKGTNAISDK